MLSLLKFTIKWAVLSLLILTLGNWVHWNGRTLSEIVKTTMAPFENKHLLETAQKWGEGLTRDAKQGLQNKLSSSSSQMTSTPMEQEVPRSERQKLRTLIRELSSSDTTD